MKQTHVDAIIGGTQTRFEIQRLHLPSFEQEAGSAFEVLSRLLEGKWTYADINSVLRHAGHKPTETENLAARLAISARGAGHAFQSHLNIRSDYSDVINRNGPATYAELAMNVLIAALMGIEPDAEIFDDAGSN